MTPERRKEIEIFQWPHDHECGTDYGSACDCRRRDIDDLLAYVKELEGENNELLQKLRELEGGLEHERFERNVDGGEVDMLSGIRCENVADDDLKICGGRCEKHVAIIARAKAFEEAIEACKSVRSECETKAKRLANEEKWMASAVTLEGEIAADNCIEAIRKAAGK